MPATRQKRAVLPFLTVTGSARRIDDVTVNVLPGRDGGGNFLFGPHWWLPAGRYRLSFDGRIVHPGRYRQPVLSIEVIAQNRFRQAWRDYTAAELWAGDRSLEFEVPEAMGAPDGQEARFEFKFFHHGQIPITLTRVTLEPLGAAAGAAPPEPLWRLLGQLTRGWHAWRRPDGSLRVGAWMPPGLILRGGWPYLRLAAGRYRLSLRAKARAGEEPVLSVEVWGRSLWRWRWLRQLLHPKTRELRELVAARSFTGAQLPQAALVFNVTDDLSLESGENAPFEIRLCRRTRQALEISDIQLERLGPLPEAVRQQPARRSARVNIVLVGNCQADVICAGFQRIAALNQRFAVKYHFVNLQPNLHDAARQDLARADMVLAQSISDWQDYPLQEAIPAGVPVIRFPLLRLASLWPFDHYNGPGDSHAHQREWPNLTFTYMDGLLARLRREIPDPEARFRAYAALDMPGLVNYRRLQALEEKRLTAMDAEFDGGLGAFILENFRKRPLFYTTNHPGGELLAMMLRQLVKAVDGDPGRLPARDLEALRVDQVPVHPKVAADLGVAWATRETRYLFRGTQLTWEDYIRRYIAHYG